MVLYVRTLEKKIVVKIDSFAETIGHIKQKIMDKEGLLPECQRLIFAGKQLDDDKTLSECLLSKESTLHLVLPLRGEKKENPENDKGKEAGKETSQR
eukprot:CAMPEP_0170175566 /NCGR_PEP_ID=MMETSP0040_2-20121228/8622_1 /TAXON_ID=641309 /ORGANISM="Lotharella oceanica, Strain CCMP622" /LENGTH=96 /DNA_ID=CAMNT_0010417589 /DNA_START=69 /DNA_END=359 /DNA_ORIENTATION=-